MVKNTATYPARGRARVPRNARVVQNYGNRSLQCLSSVPSPQSSTPLHFIPFAMHRLFLYGERNERMWEIPVRCVCPVSLCTAILTGTWTRACCTGLGIRAARPIRPDSPAARRRNEPSICTGRYCRWTRFPRDKLIVRQNTIAVVNSLTGHRFDETRESQRRVQFSR